MRVDILLRLITAMHFLFPVLPVPSLLAGLTALLPATEPVDLIPLTSGNHILGFAADGMYAAAGSRALHVAFVGANRVPPRSDAPADPSGRAAPLGRVTYADLWDGIDLVYSADEGGIYTTTYTLEPDADPEDILLRYNATPELTESGTLRLDLAGDELTESAPIAWQDIGGERIPVEAAFRVNGREVGFALGSYDPRHTLTIDPHLIWNTFLGGAGNEVNTGIAVDGDSNVYITGYSNTANLGELLEPHSGTTDAVIMKLDSGSYIIWGRYLGGDGEDRGYDVLLDDSGNVYVIGYSNGTWGSPLRAHSGGEDAFVAKIDSSGNLTWNTFLGGGGDDRGTGLGMGSSTDIFVTGSSDSSWGSPVRTHSGGSDVFAARLSPGGSLTWNTFLGGGGDDTAADITVGGSTSYVAGTSSEGWGSPVRAYEGGLDSFAARLNSSGVLEWNTFLGGTGDDSASGIVVDASADVFVAGTSSAAWGLPDRGYSGGMDAFVAKLEYYGAFTGNTFLGGAGDDYATDITLDWNGYYYISGCSDAAWGSPKRAYSEGFDGFAVKFNSSLQITWNTFLGGAGTDELNGVAADGNGYVFVSGSSDADWGGPIYPYISGQDGFYGLLSGGFLALHAFWGGDGSVSAYGIAIDGAGDLVVVGVSEITWEDPVHEFTGGGEDAFVAKLDSSGALLWNTFLGSLDDDSGQAVAVDGAGNIYVIGESDAAWGSPVRAYSDGTDAFAAKLDPSGNLVWNTFLGGTQDDEGEDIVADGSGTVYLTGTSRYSWGSPVRPQSGSRDAYVARLDSSGTLVWNTFLGAGTSDYGKGLALGDSGGLYAVGYGSATWGSPLRAYTSGNDAFVARIDLSGTLVWNTFLGGIHDDSGVDIAVDGSGNLFVLGYSSGTWGDPLHEFSGNYDPFLVRLDPSGGLLWNTFFGTDTTEGGLAIILDSDDNSYVAGRAFKSWGNPYRPYSGASDAFVAKFDSAGSPVSLTFLGGSGNDNASSIARDDGGRIFVAGRSMDAWGSPVREYDYGTEAFVAEVDFSLPVPFGKTGPSDGAAVSADPVLSWESSGAAESYEYCYDTSDDGSCDGAWTSTGTDTGAGLTGLSNGVTYYWQVRAMNASGETEADAGGWWSFTVPLPPGPFTKFSPSDDSFTPTTTTLFWGASSDVESYEYCYDTTDDDVCDGSWISAGIDTSAGVSGLGGSTVYYWQVRAVNAAGTTEADGGTWWSFTTLPPPPGSFNKSSPSDDSFTITDPDLTWDAGAGADVYEYCIDTSDNDTCDGSWISTGSDLYAALSGLTAHTTFYWQIRAVNIGGQTYADGGTWWSFTALPVSFTDVPSSYWAWSWIERLFHAGITSGCGGGNYCPDQSATRAEMAIFLERGIHGSSYTPPAATGTVFGDVPVSHWAADWIEQLAADGITSGCGGGNYCPNDPVTRAEMAIFLLRSKNGSSYTPPAPSGMVFDDVPISHWAAAWIEQLAAEGITSGCGGGNYCPNNPVTRAEMAIFLVRTFDLP